MTAPKLSSLSIGQLIDRFIKISLGQDECIQLDDNDKYSMLYKQMVDVELELKSRDGDARRELLQLYDYPNMEVRLKAAKATLAIEPLRARQALEAIRVSKFYPAALDAGMCLRALNDGTFRPT